MRQFLHRAVDVICDAMDIQMHYQRARHNLMVDLARAVAPYLQPVIIREPVYVRETIIDAEIVKPRKRWKHKAARNTMPIACADTVAFIGHDKPGQIIDVENPEFVDEKEESGHKRPIEANTKEMDSLLRSLGERVRKGATREELDAKLAKIIGQM